MHYYACEISAVTQMSPSDRGTRNHFVITGVQLLIVF
jgi:hypothetical protein